MKDYFSEIKNVASFEVEGTFPLGACVAAILISAGCPAIIATIIALLAGAFFGMITGILHTKLKIPAILSGIITMTGLYTINMMVLGKITGIKNNLVIDSKKTIFYGLRNFFDSNRDNIVEIVLGILIALCILGIVIFGIRLIKSIVSKKFKENLKSNVFTIVIVITSNKITHYQSPPCNILDFFLLHTRRALQNLDARAPKEQD